MSEGPITIEMMTEACGRCGLMSQRDLLMRIAVELNRVLLADRRRMDPPSGSMADRTWSEPSRRDRAEVAAEIAEREAVRPKGGGFREWCAQDKDRNSIWLHEGPREWGGLFADYLDEIAREGG